MLLSLLIVFLACVAFQSAYLILLSFGFTKQSPNQEESFEPVSVIIAAKNEVGNLKKLLPKLYDQSHPDYEVIVVNDQSTDETYDFLKQESANSKLRVVTVEEAPDHVNSKKYALTLGIKAAKNDLLLFTDADCEPLSAHWINQMSAKGSDKKIVLGFSDYLKKPGFLNYFIRFETLLTAIQYIGFALLGRPYMGVGRNLGYRKSLFLNNKGFNGYMNIVGGDDDLFVNKHATANNTAVAIGSDANTTSIPKENWRAYFKQKLRHLSVGTHYKLKDKIILGVFSLSYLLSWLLLPLLLVYQIELYVVIGSFLIRTLFLHLTFFLSTKRLNVSFNLWGLVFLELVYVFFYCYTGMTALFTKRITWS